MAEIESVYQQLLDEKEEGGVVTQLVPRIQQVCKEVEVATASTDSGGGEYHVSLLSGE